MIGYCIASEAMQETFLLLNRLLGVTVTFFEPDGTEIAIPGLLRSAYCRRRRRQADFEARCRACDAEHLAEVARGRRMLIYRCHDGLLEGLAPLVDRDGIFLGALVFGQVREAGAAPRRDLPAALRRLHERAPEISLARAGDIGRLLGYVGGHILANELVRWRSLPWAEHLKAHIQANLGAPLRIADLARCIGRSAVFVSRHFPGAFGMSPRRYIRQARMEAAARLLAEGETVARTAIRLGFYDPFHFSKAFRSYWKTPPSRYTPA